MILFFVSIVMTICTAQKFFAPLGAVWNYEGKSEWNSTIMGCTGDHRQYLVEEELLMNGNNCSMVRASSGDSLIIWEDSDRIYFLQDSVFFAVV